MSQKNKEIQKLHNSTKRDYLARMNDSKIDCMIKAKKFSKEYWDGNRRFGYGGYSYLEGRNDLLVKKLIKKYSLTNKSKILDVGCGKGYLIYDIKRFLPKISVYGIDISKYAIQKSKKEIKRFLNIHNIKNRTKFDNNYFDLVISLNTLHNLKIFDLYKAINEIDRISKNSFIVVESYRNEIELFNLQCWALTCESFFSKEEWIWIFKELGYKKDYDFIYFK